MLENSYIVQQSISDSILETSMANKLILLPRITILFVFFNILIIIVKTLIVELQTNVLGNFIFEIRL